MIDVLVIEDDDETREILRQVLGEAGLETHGAADGREALEWLRATDELPRLILLNLYMPVMNGFAFRAEQMADAALRDIPTIVVTGNADGDPERLRAMGCPVIRKPFAVEELNARIRAELD